jgi:hypothetical protein
MKAKSANPSKTQSDKILGVICIFGAVIIGLTYQCPTNTVRFILYGIFGIGLCLLFSNSAEKSKLIIPIGKINKWALTGSVALVIGLMYWNPIKLYGSDPKCIIYQKTSLTVKVASKIGIKDETFIKSGNVHMYINGQTLTQQIDNNGEVKFSGLLIGDSFRLSVESGAYVGIHPDSTYFVSSNQQLDLILRLPKHPIHGKVIDNKLPLEGVIVSIDRTLGDTTDKYGNFSISIPDSAQEEYYKVWFSKPGYLIESADARPQDDRPLDQTMHKLSRGAN